MSVKPTLIALVIASGAGLSSAQAEAVKIGIAAEPYPAFASPEASGSYSGWEIDLIHAVCAKAEMDCEIVPTSWDGLIPSLPSQKIDVIAASMGINAERLKVIDFSNKYYQTDAGILAAQGAGILPTAEGLAGKTLAVQAASIHQAYARKHFPEVETRVYATYDEATQDLFAGRVDAVMADVLSNARFLASDEGAACCEDTGTVEYDVVIHGPGIGFGLRKGDPLKDKLNAAIEDIRHDGSYAEFTAKYFPFDIFGD
ncbi:transporter substrate-binding domain-containing protein [Arenibacterium sp. LLYu02]|uniref:transporter substrate-binding domain-containing protein n=1 Tax=Arenibacterium sp. LLYu02 TaxID=3404132 RepID=UPI003B20BFC7